MKKTDLDQIKNKTPQKKIPTKRSASSCRTTNHVELSSFFQKELREWNNTFGRIFNMMSIIIPQPSIPLDSSANKRLVLEEMCSQICKQASKPPKKNKVLKKKHDQSPNNNTIKYKNKYLKLKEEYKQLLFINEQNLLLIDQQREIIEDQKKNVLFEEKINRVEELLFDHINKSPQKTKKRNKNQPQKEFVMLSKDFNDVSYSFKDEFDIKTTKAISKYRKIARRQATMERKTRPIYKYTETPRSPTPMERMSQEYVDTTLRKLPFSSRDHSTTPNVFSTPKKD